MAPAEPKTAHLRAKIGIAEGKPGTMFFASPTRARTLIAARQAELVNSCDVPRGTIGGILCRSTGWPLDRFSTVRPDWVGKTAVLFGGGPSLTLEQVETVRRVHETGQCRAIAINDSYLVAPWADVLYGADSVWWAWHAEGVAKPALNLTAGQVRERFEAFPGERCTIQNSGANVTDSRIHMLRNKAFPGHSNKLSTDPGALATGRNSAFQALNLAILAGAKKIILLGIDGKPAADGRTHFAGGHPRPTLTAAYGQYLRAWADVKIKGARVINCSPGTAVEAFERMPIDVALA